MVKLLLIVAFVAHILLIVSSTGTSSKSKTSSGATSTSSASSSSSSSAHASSSSNTKNSDKCNKDKSTKGTSGDCSQTGNGTTGNATKCTNPNEIYDPCPPGCPPQRCGFDPAVTLCAPSPTVGDPECQAGCRCIDGYVRNDDEVCIPRDQCPVCGDYEIYSTCVNGGCYGARNCSEKGRPEICVDLIEGACRGGCICQDSYLRDEDGTCIPEDECPNSNDNCTGMNEFYDSCPPYCSPQTCESIGVELYCPPHTQVCRPACRCNKGYYRNSQGTCITEEECKTCTQPNEEYEICPVTCPPQTCEAINKTFHCPLIKTKCEGQGSCRCKSGYYRNAINDCISEENCLKCSGPNEFYSCGGACDNVCETLNQQNQTNCPIINIKCNEMCYCKEGYARDSNGTCIPIENCPVPSTCNGDPNAHPGCGINCGKHCSDYNSTEETACIEICNVNGCDCNEGYLFDDNTKSCVLPKECTFSCNGDPNAHSGCGVNCGRHCSNYNSTEEIFCSDVYICDLYGCDCNDGYVYDDNTEICVLPDQCTPPACNGDPNAHPGCGVLCGRQCSDYNSTENEFCKDISLCDLNGCDCNDGYIYDDETEMCVLPDQCPPPTCNGDPNAHTGCGVNCGRHCSDYNSTEAIFCSYICNLNGCDCNDGYVYDDITEKCVLPGQCNSIAPSACNGDPNAHPGCGINCGRYCSDYNSTEDILCNDICDPNGCDCNYGYVYDDNDTGLCVLPDQCITIAPPECNGDPNAHPGCGINCGRHCSDYNSTEDISCNDMCDPIGCDCNNGYIYDDNTGLCVLPDQCTPPACNGDPNAHPGCGINRGRHCSDYNSTKYISYNDICDPDGCDCNSGYVYDNDIGLCVLPDQCTSSTCNGDPNAHTGCGVNCGRHCSDYNSTEDIFCSDICNLNGCDCNDGYVYDDFTEKCVPPDQCTPTCGVNEEYSTCTQSLCRNQNCSEIGQPIACPRVIPEYCKKGCVCKENYLRSQNGTCVPEDQCDTCPAGEDYNTCPPEKCDAEYCPLSENSPAACNSTKNCGKPRCICGFNQKRDRSTKECIDITECPPFKCGRPNEEYQPCPAICPGEDCSDYINNSTCPKFGRIGIRLICRPQCRCKKNFYRNCNGICVKGSQCLKESTTTVAPPKTTTIAPSCGATDPSDTDAQQRLITGNNLFSIKFLESVLATTSDNVIMSAFSIEILLAELTLYSDGPSYNQLISLLNLANKDEIRKLFKTYLVELRSQKNVQFDIAAKTYVNDKYELTDAFKQDTGEIFGATAENVDCSDPTQAAATMNQWVEDNTNDLIKDLVSPDIVKPDTVLFLLDAIYFKSKWLHTFNTNDTEVRDFYINNSTTEQVQTMYQKNKFKYAYSSKLGAKILSMPYENPNFTCLFILPNDIEGLNDLVKKMQDYDLVNSEIESMTTETVKVWIPTMEIQTTINLVDTLKETGITYIFEPSTSGLDGIFTTPEALYVSSGVQKAYVKINEEGSEAAAANVIGITALSASIEPIQDLEFDANHPFLIFIREENTIVFCGVFRK